MAESAEPSAPAPAPAPAVNHMDMLYSAAHSLEDTFMLEGSVAVPNAAIVPRAGAAAAFPKISFPLSMNKVSATMEPLLAACHQAPFGHGKETKVDTTVREALALKASEFEIEGFDPSPLLNGIRAALVPDASAVVAELDKLNIYQVGGHFSAHRDTPADEAHFGTLVVILPSGFAGGVLTIKHGKEVRDIDYASKIGGPFRYYSSWRAPTPAELDFTPRPEATWVAFFGHCEHAISKVTLGTRVTLAYKLRRVDAAPAPAAGPSPLPEGVPTVALLRATEFSRTLAAALADPTFYPEGTMLGFPCYHLYVEEDLPKAAIPSNATAGSLRLKGADVIIAMAAVAAGLKVTVARLMHEDSSENFFCTRIPTFTDARKVVEPVYLEDSLMMGGAQATKVDLEALQSDFAHPKLHIGSVDWVVSLSDHRVRRAPWVEDIWVSGTDYFGNEANQSAIYTSAAILVDIPSAAARVTLARKLAAKARAPAPAAAAAAAAAAPAASATGPAAAADDAGAAAAMEVEGKKGEGAGEAAPAEVSPASSKGQRGKRKAAARRKTTKRAASANDDDDDDDEEEKSNKEESQEDDVGATQDESSLAPASAAFDASRLAGFKAGAPNSEEELKQFFAASSRDARFLAATIPQLKALLRTKKLPLGGKKEQLASRAAAAGFTTEELDAAGVKVVSGVFRGTFKQAPRSRGRWVFAGDDEFGSDDSEGGGARGCVLM